MVSAEAREASLECTQVKSTHSKGPEMQQTCLFDAYMESVLPNDINVCLQIPPIIASASRNRYMGTAEAVEASLVETVSWSQCTEDQCGIKT